VIYAGSFRFFRLEGDPMHLLDVRVGSRLRWVYVQVWRWGFRFTP